MKVEKNELENFNNLCENLGYKKYNGHYREEDYGYWKTFHEGENDSYQIAILVYDHTKFEAYTETTVGITMCCLIEKKEISGNVGMHISEDNIKIDMFEVIAESYFQNYLETIKPFLNE